MAKVVFIRHGEPDYTKVTALGFKGHGRDLGQLTKAGIEQAHQVSKDPRLNGAEVLLSSPYTRALQTAAILSKAHGLDIEVVTELHEWVPDLTYHYSDVEVVNRAAKALTVNKGECPDDFNPPYETLASVFERAMNALKPYLNHEKIIVVCHGIVMRQFKFVLDLDYCGVLEVDMDEAFEWGGFVEN